MLRWRLAGTAAILCPILLILWLDDQKNWGHPGVWFGTTVLVFCALATLELAALLRHKCETLSLPIVALASLAAGLTTFIPAVWPNGKPDCPMGDWGWLTLGLSLATGIVMVNELREFEAGKGATERIAMSLLCVFYVAIPFAYILRLRLNSPDRMGLMAVMSIVFIAKIADTGAYFAGRYLGKNPMAPILSPKKTWEGAVGGLLAAGLGGLLFTLVILPQLVDAAKAQLLGTLAMSVCVGIAGMIGDLAISLFKRDVDQKDSANWLPGLGGVLDIMDSLLWAAPVGYIFWVAGWVVETSS